MKKIPITQDKFALVDDEDYERLCKRKWSVQKDHNTYYAVGYVKVDGKYSRISMHREILGLTSGDGKLVDHKDRNGLNCQRYNMRIATKSLNCYNCKENKNNKSGYRGVCWYKETEKWKAYLKVKRINIHLGYYINIKNAAESYDKAAIKYYGKEAILNFPLKRRY